MKYIKINLYNLFVLFAFALVYSSCDKLELQKDYDYKGQPLDPHVDMTAWEFMNSRPDVFSIMKEAVEYAGMEEYYSQTDSLMTYLFVNDTGMQTFITSRGGLEITHVDVEVVKNFLRYHMIRGEYHAYNKKLPVEPIYVKTMLKGEDGLLTIKVNKSSTNSVGSPIANGNIVVNETASNFRSKRISSVTSNIMPVNGVIHVFSDYAYYRKDANYTPAF